ncbi:MAG: cyclic nucleotide-binding domain-containing protein [Gammaproteobacteria bacterium]|nr:cyclic nucleotide-binding domain-containing protein [Gammaproteobacteria bacterium]
MTSEKINLIQFLNQQHLCESLTIKEVQLLLDYTEVVTFSKNQIIAEIGTVGESLYFVIKGQAGLIHVDGTNETEVGRVHEGELMGEMSFFDLEPRSVRMMALKNDTQLLKLSRTMYNRLRVEYPYIAVNILEHAIVSLDHLFRRLSSDVATYSNILYGKGKH